LESPNPTVSIITPTTPDRSEFNSMCLLMSGKQNYLNIIEHLFDYSEQSIGFKRNSLCERAKGDVIIHMDSDDYYSIDWVSKCIEALQYNPCVGLRCAYFHDLTTCSGYKWSYPAGAQIYLAEATMAYTKPHWQQFKHHNVNSGECYPLYHSSRAHDYTDGFVARLHGNNTSSHNQVRTFQPIDINVINLVYSKG